MKMRRLTRHAATWIAFVALLFAALAPSMFSAMAAASGQAWTEICSVGGSRFVHTGGDQSATLDPATPLAMQHEHCPLCATHGNACVLPPHSGLTVALLARAQTHPPLFFQAPHPLPAWIAAQPRAPPALA